MMNIRILPAAHEHLDSIHGLVLQNSGPNALLPRTRGSIEATLENWVVALGAGKVIGCGSLMSYDRGLVEIRSLAVADGLRGMGTGSRIVHELVYTARMCGLQSVFALTRAADLFHKCGFRTVPIDCFPEKVLHFCTDCPNKNACDETAVVLDLTDESFTCQGTGRQVITHLPKSTLPGSVLLAQ